MHKEINEIRKKKLQNPWPKFVNAVTLSGLRGWTGQKIRFEFPVCAIAGENGSGKSTILKALASLYDDPSRNKKKRFFPSDFFPQTTWDEVKNVEITYDIVEGDRTLEYKIKRPKERWRLQEPRPRRHVVWQDISRTLPISATIGYAKVANVFAKETASKNLSREIIRYYSTIMGKQYVNARICNVDADPEKDVSVVGVQDAEYSQFHQGAGEDATFDLLTLLQDLPDFSLIIIDEIEASLHPRSQRRLIHFLLWISRVKCLQVVLSTHSRYILEELPEEGRIFIERTSIGPEIKYGVSTDYALNRMDDLQIPSLYVFSEDYESQIAAKSILRIKNTDISDIQFMSVGAANIVSAIGSATNRSGFPVRAIGLLDADQENQNGCIKLPGTMAPEMDIFISIRNNQLELLSNRLGKPLQATEYSLDRAMTARDHHDWPLQFSNFIGEATEYVWETMCRIWAEFILSDEERELFKSQFDAALIG